MDLQSLHKRLLPCDVNSPYIFISYSSDDREIVWNDVVELQSRGYNLWIDEPNLDKTKESWKLGALEAIDNINCKLLVFYVSQHSLFSEACLEEIERTRSEQTNRTHFGNVDFFAIECEQIGNIKVYIQSLKQQTENSNLDYIEKNKLLTILYDFSIKWFTPDNERVRIHSKSDPHRCSDYYQDIENVLSRNMRDVKSQPKRLYRFAVDHIIKGELDKAIQFLTIASVSYLPAVLLLAYFELHPTENLVKAEELWNSVEKIIPSEKWGEKGIDEAKNMSYSEAIAWLLAYGEKNKNPEFLYKAGQIWARKGCKDQTMAVLKIAASMGYKKARELIFELQKIPANVFLDRAWKEEQ